MSVRTLLPFVLLAMPVLCGCDGNSGENTGSDGDGLKLVATTGHVHDALVAITKGTDPTIDLFCGPGVDPHSFDASPGDVQKMEAADAIFFNGYHLEARLHDLLRGKYGEKSWSMSTAFPKDSAIDWLEDGEVDPEAPFDPHIWHHLEAWAGCVTAMAEQMAKVDPANADLYKKNGKAYVKEILDTHDWAKKELSKLPEDRRFLVSAHDAFNYFARVYGLETVAVLGVGNDPEADIKTMRDVASVISDKKVPVIFMESITNPKVTQALKEACKDRGWEVKIATQRLYSDDLGEEAPADTHLGSFRKNVETIVNQLGGSE